MTSHSRHKETLANIMSMDTCTRLSEYDDDIREIRRHVFRRFRGLRATITWIQRTPDLPQDLASRFTNEVLREALEWLYASHGKKFNSKDDNTDVSKDDNTDVGKDDNTDVGKDDNTDVGKDDDTGLFDEPYTDSTVPGSEEVMLYLRRQRDSVSGIPRYSEITHILYRMERFISMKLSTEKEVVRAHRIRRIIIFMLPVFFACIAVYLYFFFRSRVSGVDPGEITYPGGIVGTYYNGKDFDKRILARVDRQININTRKSPAPGVNADHFSIRWDGFIRAPKTGPRYICVGVDDGARVFLDRELLINDWTAGPYRRACKKVRLSKGWYRLRVDYFEETLSARMELLWGTDKRHLSLVPAKYLCCKVKDGNEDRHED